MTSRLSFDKSLTVSGVVAVLNVTTCNLTSTNTISCQFVKGRNDFGNFEPFSSDKWTVSVFLS